MKKFQGTKGNWQVVDTFDDYHEYSKDNPHIIIWDGDEQASAPICDMGELGDFDYAEALSNAKLIAKAPELAKCLEDFIDSCYRGCSKSELDILRQNAERVLNEAF